MRTHMQAWSIVAVVVAGMTLSPGAAPAGESALRLGYLTATLAHPFQVHLLDAVKGEAERLGMTMEVRDAGENAALQARQVNELLAAGMDALIVVPADNAWSDAMVAAARRAKVPLVFVNRNPYPGQRPPDRVYFVGTDPFVEGELQMRFAGGEIGPEGKVLVLEGPRGNLASRGRIEGVRSVAASEYPQLALLDEAPGNWREEQARTVTLQWIDAYGAEKIDAILAGNDVMALGAIEALQERGLDGVLVVGVDALPEALAAVRGGTLAGTVSQDTGVQGRLAVQVARDAAVGVKRPQITTVPSEMVTLANVGGYLESRQ